MFNEIDELISNYKAEFEDRARELYAEFIDTLRHLDEQSSSDDSDVDLEERRLEMHEIAERLYDLAYVFCIEHRRPIAHEAGHCPPRYDYDPPHVRAEKKIELDLQDWLSEHFGETWTSGQGFGR